MRILGCVFTLLVLISVPASSLAGEVSESPSSPASILPFAADSSLCLAGALPPSVSIEQSLPASGPIAIRRCGACSSVYCRGVAVNGACYNGGPGALVCVDAGVCSADGSVQCACSGPM